MRNLVCVSIGLAALAIALAVVSSLAATFANRLVFWVPPESFSRACTNLALLAIAVSLVARKGEAQSASKGSTSTGSTLRAFAERIIALRFSRNTSVFKSGLWVEISEGTISASLAPVARSIA